MKNIFYWFFCYFLLSRCFFRPFSEIFGGLFCAYYDHLCVFVVVLGFLLSRPFLLQSVFLDAAKNIFYRFSCFLLSCCFFRPFSEIFWGRFSAYYDDLCVFVVFLGFFLSRPFLLQSVFLNAVKNIFYCFCSFLLSCCFFRPFFFEIFGVIFGAHYDGLGVLLLLLLGVLASRPSCCSLCFLDAVKNSFYYYSCVLLLCCFFRPFFSGEFWDHFCSCYDGLCILLLLLRIGFLSLFSSCCIPCILDAVKNIFYYYCFFFVCSCHG